MASVGSTSFALVPAAPATRPAAADRPRGNALVLAADQAALRNAALASRRAAARLAAAQSLNDKSAIAKYQAAAQAAEQSLIRAENLVESDGGHIDILV